MNKQDIKQWCIENIRCNPEPCITDLESHIARQAYLIEQCFSDLQPQWVSVDDRLPEVIQVSRWVRESDSVLLIDDKGSQCVAFYSNEFDGTNGGWVLPTQRFAKIGQHPDFNISQDITHWQPLPLPPSEGE